MDPATMMMLIQLLNSALQMSGVMPDSMGGGKGGGMGGMGGAMDMFSGLLGGKKKKPKFQGFVPPEGQGGGGGGTMEALMKAAMLQKMGGGGGGGNMYPGMDLY